MLKRTNNTLTRKLPEPISHCIPETLKAQYDNQPPPTKEWEKERSAHWAKFEIEGLEADIKFLEQPYDKHKTNGEVREIEDSLRKAKSKIAMLIEQLEFQVAPEAPPAATQPQAAPAAEAHPQSATENYMNALADPERRLIALRELGGTARYKRGRGGIQAWQFTGIQMLVNQEKKLGRKRHDEKTIRKDLREAAEAESLRKRTG